MPSGFAVHWSLNVSCSDLLGGWVEVLRKRRETKAWIAEMRKERIIGTVNRFQQNKEPAHILVPSFRIKQAKRSSPLGFRPCALKKTHICVRVRMRVCVYVHFTSIFLPLFHFFPLLQKLDWKCSNLIRKCCFRWYF